MSCGLRRAWSSRFSIYPFRGHREFLVSSELNVEDSDPEIPKGFGTVVQYLLLNSVKGFYANHH